MNLSSDQEQNAYAIVAQAKAKFGDNSVGKQAAIIGIMAALQESKLQNLTYGDRDSLGVFQQRASWGTVSQRENPTWAAQQFFNHLASVKGWQTLDYGAAAQAVQVSAYPTLYSGWQSEATDIVNNIWGTTVPSMKANKTPLGLTTVANTLSSESFWQRSGIFILGAILLLFVIIKMVSGSKTATNVINTVKDVIPSGTAK